jgi:hypothetical protein
MTSAGERNCLRAIISIPFSTNSQRGQDKTDETVTKIIQSTCNNSYNGKMHSDTYVREKYFFEFLESIFP